MSGDLEEVRGGGGGGAGRGAAASSRCGEVRPPTGAGRTAGRRSGLNVCSSLRRASSGFPAASSGFPAAAAVSEEAAADWSPAAAAPDDDG